MTTVSNFIIYIPYNKWKLSYEEADKFIKNFINQQDNNII